MRDCRFVLAGAVVAIMVGASTPLAGQGQRQQRLEEQKAEWNSWQKSR